MKVKVISDTHNLHEKLKIGSCDVLIHCGDFGTRGNYTEAESFMYWFVKQNAKYKIFIAGNHDKRMKSYDKLKQLAKDLGLIYLEQEAVTIEGYKFYGHNFVPRVNKLGTFLMEDGEREQQWSAIHEHDDIDILITHSPAFNRLSKNSNDINIGCYYLLEAIKALEIPYHLCGHVHEYGGQIDCTFHNEGKSTLHINAACLDRQYNLVRGYQEFDLEDRIVYDMFTRRRI